MSTPNMNCQTRRVSFIRPASISTATVLLLCFALPGWTATQNNARHAITERLSHSADLLTGELAPLSTPDPIPGLLAAVDSSDPRHHPWQDDIAWLTDVGTLLYADHDRDGYYAGFSLTIDADSVYDQMEVYLTFDVQATDNVTERLHTSADFNLYGNSLTDEYRVDIDLLQNYPADLYDISVSLYDAYDNRLLDSVDAGDFSNLARLPLESEDLDYLPLPDVPVNEPVRPANDNIVVTEHAGTAGYSFALLLLTALFLRHKTTRRTNPVASMQTR